AEATSPASFSIGHPDRTMTNNNGTGKAADTDGGGHRVLAGINSGNRLVETVGHPNPSLSRGNVRRPLAGWDGGHNLVGGRNDPHNRMLAGNGGPDGGGGGRDSRRWPRGLDGSDNLVAAGFKSGDATYLRVTPGHPDCIWSESNIARHKAWPFHQRLQLVGCGGVRVILPGCQRN